MHHISYANWSGAEYTAALRCLFGGQVADGDNPAKLAHAFAERYAPSTAYPMNYGHNAIHVALEAFAKRMLARVQVVVPAYICPSVVETVLACGLQPVLADVGDDLNLNPATVAEVLCDDTLAVIAPHMYGCPARIAEIETLCRDAGIFLVDDAAQVVGVRQDGRLLGTFGDAGIISFAQSKTVVTGIRGSGGILLVNNPDFDADARQAWQQLPLPSRRLGAFLNFLWNYVWSARTGNSGYYFGRIGDRLGLERDTQSARARISNLEAAIALAQLERLPIMQRDRIRVAAAYHRELQESKEIGFPQYAPDRYLARIMLSLPESSNLVALRNNLKQAGVDTRVAYPVPAGLGKSGGNAMRWSQRLLEVPAYAGLDEREVGKICSILRSALQSAPVTWKQKQ